MSSHQPSQKSFWIHCNQCFLNYIQKERKFYILSCYHIACDKCGRLVKQEQIECPLCKKPSGRRLICNDLHPKLKQLFHPRPWELSFEKSYPIVKFQTKQRIHFTNGCAKMAEYARILANKRDHIRGECRMRYMSKQRIKQERLQLAAVLRKLLQKKTNVSQRMSISRSSDTMESIETSRAFKPFKRTIHPTCTAPAASDFTFDFPNESRLSKSFVL